MAYTPLSNSFRVSTITHGGTSIGDPIGGNVDETVGTVNSMPGTRLSPATAIDSYKCTATAKSSLAFSPITRGTKATLTYTLLKYDGTTTGTFAVTNMIALGYKASFDEKPHKFSQEFEYSAGDTENLAPISIT